MDIRALTAAYAIGASPAQVIAECYAGIARDDMNSVRLSLAPLDQVLANLAAAKQRRTSGETLPLFGIPFAVKNNIDVAGLPTTAASPAYRHIAERSSTVVAKLEAAGALLLGVRTRYLFDVPHRLGTSR